MQKLVIDIEAPCNEKWSDMPKTKKGRHCSNCEKTVIDFSGMSDNQIFEYFTTHQNFCGRFRNNQLGRSIIKSEIPFKRRINLPTKIAACIFTFLSLKSTNSVAQEKKAPKETIINTSYEKYNGKLTIRGFIKDGSNKLIAQAEVFFNNIKLTQSDENGFYEIKVANPLLKSHTISFRKEGYRGTAFSFHPRMGNTDQSIKLYKRENLVCYRHTMGAPRMPNFDAVYFGKVSFSKKRSPSTEVKNRLKEVARNMRANPNAKVKVLYYYPDEKRKQSYLIDAHQVVNYLVDEQGIDRGRFQIELKKSVRKAKTLEMTNAFH